MATVLQLVKKKERNLASALAGLEPGRRVSIYIYRTLLEILLLERTYQLGHSAAVRGLGVLTI